MRRLVCYSSHRTAPRPDAAQAGGNRKVHCGLDGGRQEVLCEPDGVVLHLAVVEHVVRTCMRRRLSPHNADVCPPARLNCQLSPLPRVDTQVDVDVALHGLLYVGRAVDVDVVLGCQTRGNISAAHMSEHAV